MGKEEWLIFWVCTSVFIHYGGSLVMSYHKVQPRELHETSHTQSTCGKPGWYWRSWGLQQLYSENSEVWYAAIFEHKDPDSFCVQHPYLGFKPEGDAGGELLQKYLPNHTSGLVERNLAVY